MRMGVRGALRVARDLPAWVYQRQQKLWDRAFLAAGWMWLYLLCSGIEPWVRVSVQNGSEGGGLLPPQWRVVLAALVLAFGLWRPLAGYAAFIVAIAYPLYLISIYVMALGLAVLVLLAPMVAVYEERGVVFLALLVLLTVVLAPVHLSPVVPLLIGLWWKGAGSWIGGGLAALWLKLCAGMSGHPVDLWSLFGWRMQAAPVYERFHTANSLQTVALLLRPFGIRLASLAPGAGLSAGPGYPTSPGLYILLNLLQVCAWAAAAFVVGAVLDRLSLRWAGRGRAGVQAALGLLPGLVLVWAAFVAVPAWLGVAGPGWFDPSWLAMQIVWLGLVAWCLDALLRYLQRPVSLKAPGGELPGDVVSVYRPEARSGPYEQAEVAPNGGRRPLGRVGLWRRQMERRRSRDQAAEQSSDIMIELD
jgi:hypothetical protein